MAVYAAFNESDGFSAITDVINIYSVNDALVRTGVRAALGLWCTGHAAAGTYWGERSFGPLASGWVGWRWHRANDAGTGTPNTAAHFNLFDDQNQSLVAIRAVNDTSGDAVLHFMGGGPVGGTFPIQRNMTGRVDIYWLGHTSDGRIDVWVNGQRFYRFTGATLTNGATGAALARWSPVSHRNAGVRTGTIAEIVISDECTIHARVNTLSFSTSPTVHTMSGTFSNITGSSTNSDESHIAGDVDGEQFVAPPQLSSDRPPSYPNYYLSAVIVSCRARFQSSSPVEGLVPLVRRSGTNYAGARRQLTTTYTGHQLIMHTNPVTGAAWTISDIGAGGSDTLGARVVT